MIRNKVHKFVFILVILYSLILPVQILAEFSDYGRDYSLRENISNFISPAIVFIILIGGIIFLFIGIEIRKVRDKNNNKFNDKDTLYKKQVTSSIPIYYIKCSKCKGEKFVKIDIRNQMKKCPTCNGYGYIKKTSLRKIEGEILECEKEIQVKLKTLKRKIGFKYQNIISDKKEYFNKMGEEYKDENSAFDYLEKLYIELKVKSEYQDFIKQQKIELQTDKLLDICTLLLPCANCPHLRCKNISFKTKKLKLKFDRIYKEKIFEFNNASSKYFIYKKKKWNLDSFKDNISGIDYAYLKSHYKKFINKELTNLKELKEKKQLEYKNLITCESCKGLGMLPYDNNIKQNEIEKIVNPALGSWTYSFYIKRTCNCCEGLGYLI